VNSSPAMDTIATTIKYASVWDNFICISANVKFGLF
jgi:hypothetical protein